MFRFIDGILEALFGRNDLQRENADLRHKLRMIAGKLEEAYSDEANLRRDLEARDAEVTRLSQLLSGTQSAARYFTRLGGFASDTAYIQLKDGASCAMSKRGGASVRRYTLKDCERHVSRGIWIEITEDAARRLSGRAE